MATRKSAAKPKGGGKKSKPSKASSKPAKSVSTEGIGRGHNLSSIKRELKPFIQRLDALHSQMEADAGEHMGNINAVYDEAKDVLGVPKKLIAITYKELRAEQKRIARDAKMMAEDRDTLDMMRAAVGDLFSKAGVEMPAPAPKSAIAAAMVEAIEADMADKAEDDAKTEQPKLSVVQ